MIEKVLDTAFLVLIAAAWIGVVAIAAVTLGDHFSPPITRLDCQALQQGRMICVAQVVEL